MPATTWGTANNQEECNAIRIAAPTDGKIINVSLYSGRAEITRTFEFNIKAGQNKVTIVEFPFTMEEKSLRVEGHGNASIHDVVVAFVKDPPSEPATRVTRALENDIGNILERKKDGIGNALERARQSRKILDNYLKTITANDFDITRLEATLEGISVLSQKADERVLGLERELVEVTKKIEENKRVGNPKVVFTPNWKVSLDVHGQFDEEVKLYVKYFVNRADWTASYDVRVDTEAKEKAVTISYKAIINQSSGESWDNVPLTLETATPSFGIRPPVLLPWRVQGFASAPEMVSHVLPPAACVPYPDGPGTPYYPTAPPELSFYPPDPSMIYQPMIFQPYMAQQSVIVSNKGNIAATFRIPGIVSIPNDGENHNVTIARLSFDSALMWFSVPCVDLRVHLKASLRNDSEYPLIPGLANIYVDGSFIATTQFPLVNAQEKFDCPMGLDASVRVTYHPVEKKSSKSGFYSKTSSQSFTQRITIHNTKSTTLQNLKVIERVPISEDERIEVKVVKPPLTNPTTKGGSKSSLRAMPMARKPIFVGQNISAQWEDADEADVDKTGLGRDGKFNWLLTIPPQKSVSVVAQFDVCYPENLAIVGL